MTREGRVAMRGEGSTGSPVGIVITVYRGGCEVVHGDHLRELRLVGRHARRADFSLAVGDEVTFDPVKQILLDLLPRRTKLVRPRPKDDPRREQVIAANMDRLAIVTSIAEPPFRYGIVDRFLVAAFAGDLDALLVVNKVDLLEGASLPEEVSAFEAVVPVLAVSARTGEGLDRLRTALAQSRTVLAGHSGVGKSSLLNALEPELRLETGELRRGDVRGRHTTTRSVLLRLPGDATVIDTPGVREVGVTRLGPELLGRVYPDVALLASGCRFRDCRHDREPECAVREGVGRGELPGVRHAGFLRLVAGIEEEDPS
jgi:ribosome biogenesis GTPase